VTDAVGAARVDPNFNIHSADEIVYSRLSSPKTRTLSRAGEVDPRPGRSRSAGDAGDQAVQVAQRA